MHVILTIIQDKSNFLLQEDSYWIALISNKVLIYAIKFELFLKYDENQKH